MYIPRQMVRSGVAADTTQWWCDLYRISRGQMG
jgi:hypothetical protein